MCSPGKPGGAGSSQSNWIRQLPDRDRPLSEYRRGFAGSWHAHSIGEARRKALAARRVAGGEPTELQVVNTLGGCMHTRWDEDATATPHGQLAFFTEFLAATGVLKRWVQGCPLADRSGNAPVSSATYWAR